MDYKNEKKINSLNIENLNDTFMIKEKIKTKDPKQDSVMNSSNLNNLMGNYIKTSFNKPASKKANSDFTDSAFDFDAIGAQVPPLLKPVAHLDCIQRGDL